MFLSPDVKLFCVRTQIKAEIKGLFCFFLVDLRPVNLLVLQKEWREDPKGVFKRKVARCVRRSQEEMSSD